MTLLSFSPTSFLPQRPLNDAPQRWHPTHQRHAVHRLLRPGFQAWHVQQALLPLLSVESALDRLAERQRAQTPRDVAALLADWQQRDPEVYARLPERAFTRMVSGQALEREVERFQSRHIGEQRTLWAITWADSRTQGKVAALWIRHASGWTERVLLRPEDVFPLFSREDWQTLMQDRGRRSEWTSLTQAVYERHILPRLHPAQQARMLKVSGWAYLLSEHSALRDHPFTPGVREFYRLTTSYVLSHHAPNGQESPARYAKFRCVQSRVQAQWNGKRMLLVQDGRLNDVSYGRLPEGLHDEGVLRGLLALAEEAVAGQLRPGEQADLARITREPGLSLREQVSLTLLALKRPELLSIPGLMKRVLRLPGAAYRRFRETRPGAKALLAQLCGPLTRQTRARLKGAEQVQLLESLFQSGLRGPDLMQRALEAAPGGSMFVVSCEDYVRLAGDRAGPALLRVLEEESGDQALMLARDAGRMWAEALRALPDFRPQNVQVRALHDELSRLQPRLREANVPLVSAGEQRYARLDQTLGGLTFRRAQESHELIAVGEALSICVGSYQRQARRGECVIVVARDAQGQVRYCVEVQGRTLRQFKGRANSRPQGADLALAQAYVQAAGLQVRTSDLSGEASSAPGNELPF